MAERFTAMLGERHVVVPLDVRALWGEARPPVAGTVNGVPFRSRLDGLRRRDDARADERVPGVGGASPRATRSRS